MLLVLCRGKLKIWCQSLVILKSNKLIVGPSGKCSTLIGEVSLSLYGEICLSISYFWVWRVDAISANGTP